MDLNRLWWDERVPIHLSSQFYDLEAFRAGKCTLMPEDVEEMGSVEGKRLVHLQCHFGLDTLSWARRGATVSGLDFSAPAVEAARAIARDLGIAADFVQADVYGAASALSGRRFDVVYTGIGAIAWLPDLDRWARVVESLLEPGGRLQLTEFHPFSWVLGDDGGRVINDYFARGPFEDQSPGTYAERDAQTAHNHTLEWHHPLGEVVTAIARAGLRIERLRELETSACPFWALERRGDFWVTPEGKPRTPLMYTLVARKASG